MRSRRRPRPGAEDLPCEPSAAKRGRVAAAATSASSPWSSMPGDLVERIAERVLAGDPVDYVRLRASCRHWRASTADPRGRGVSDARFHPRQWMMLPEGHGLYPGHPRLRGRVRFFNRATGAFVGVHLPLFADHAALDCPDGLLLLQRDADTAVRLLNPFTGDIVELPPLSSLLRQARLGDDDSLRYYRRVCAAVSVAPMTGTVTVLLSLESCCRFAHACATDRSWTFATWSLKSVSRALGFNGSLYMVYNGGTRTILRIDPPPPPLNEDGDGSSSSPVLPQPQTIATLPANLMILPQLVDCDDEILVVGSTDISRSHLVVLRLADLLQQGRHVVPLKTIGDHCLFLGTRSLAVSSNGLPSIAGNAIVLCSTIPDRLQQYNLGDDTLSPACDGDIARTPPPSPHSIVHHLVTCCYRYFWNKGLIYCTGTEPKWKTKRKERFGA
ncbi:hypothetical protein EJB05_15332, partial [Eragrostis curvula]